NQDFGTLVFSPFSGLFFAVAKEFSDEIDAFCNSKQNNIPQIIADHLNIGIGKNKTTSFNIDHWLPSKEYFSDIDELPDRQPIVLNWLISSRCNCNCSYCYAGDIIDKKFENIDIRRAAQDLLNMNPLAVVLSGGEPLMEKQKIIDVLEIMGGKTGIIIDTNGLLFHKELIPLFIKYNIVIRVSLDSLQNGVNSKIRPQRDKKGDISGVNTIIQNIINYRHAGIPVLVHTVVSSMNKNSLEDLSKQLPRLNVNGWRIFTVVRPNDEAKKESFDKLMKVGKVRNMDEARMRISKSQLFGRDEIEKTVRIIRSLISQKYIAKAQDAEAESRVDYLADILGLSKKEVVSIVERMRQEGILADSKDISAYLLDAGDSKRKSTILLERFAKLEKYILNRIPDEALRISCKQLNEDAMNDGIDTSREKDIRTLLYFLAIKGYIRKKEDALRNMEISRQTDGETTLNRFEKRLEISRLTLEWLYQLVAATRKGNSEKQIVQFSVVELLNQIISGPHSLFTKLDNVQLEEVEEALLYLSKIGALKLEGGFLVLYNAMDIQRIKDNKSRYKLDDYRMLNEFYKQKIQQVHIVGEYANLMVKNYNAALQYVRDYFQMDYKKFITKYFKGDRVNEIQRNLTPKKYRQLFGQLSKCQMEIISDKDSRCIVVAAGPGSGKTRVLVHKLASLLLLEDVKHEQLLMLTFSRAAATEFKQRLMELIGNAAHFVEIKTFHSYCFDLMGRIGNLEAVRDVVAKAAVMINQGEVEPNKIGKTVLVIDEAQDMGVADHALVKALMANNEEMRVIAVGDDDQNIYEFRGSDSGYMYRLAQEPGSKFIEMTENYRSARHPVDFANKFVKVLGKRMKSTPIISMRKEDGWVRVTRHESKYMYQPLVKELVRYRGNGTMCVLTQTNEEAVILMALLRKWGIDSKLIQSMDGFLFWNMVEMRYFLRYIDKRVKTPLIPEELWENAKHATFSAYDRSQSLAYVKRCVELFEQTNKTKYVSDFKEFVFESSVEDFCDTSGADVVVSTIHKAKGREFDDVYMLIADHYVKDDQLMRRYYVGMTRAKNRLFVHTNGDNFNQVSADEYLIDPEEYIMPEEVVLQLSHKDVNLRFFKELKQEVLTLRGGDVLKYKDSILYDTLTHKPVAKLSQNMQKTLSEWKERGYEVKSASVRFIVAWKPKDAPKDEPETAVLLPDLLLNTIIS
ncbi:UvrD-helicase domain-containing protein, partial [Bacteroides nordii]|uniref:UvrD-helicase domain-containing protein n=1 Tax=Bacteroides nordii TaxID=291645 RepID=UPI00241DB28A